jgi:xanthine dehydrogenase YagS FAD-binding subunit
MAVNPFEYINPSNVAEASALLGEGRPREAVILAGGIDLLGELKDGLVSPRRVVNLKALDDLRTIRHGRGGLKIGATTTLAQIASDPKIRASYAALAQAAGSVGSPQIRNVGTIGGNLCQRPRCWYYRGSEFPCLKKGGEVCYAGGGNNKYHAILGGEPCYIVHPSDTAPALIALGARVKVHGGDGARTVPAEDFYVLPEENLLQETVLGADEVVTEVEIPRPKSGTRSLYSKFKEKGTMDFASSAVAVALRVEHGVCRSARVVLGGVAPKPWRAMGAEEALAGQRITEQLAAEAAERAVAGASPLEHNGYKVPLTRTLVRRALMSAAA